MSSMKFIVLVNFQEDFEDKGGEKLHVIPCINDRDDWVNVMS